MEGEGQTTHPLIQLRARDVMPPPITFVAYHDPIDAFAHRPVEQLVDGLRSSSVHLFIRLVFTRLVVDLITESQSQRRLWIARIESRGPRAWDHQAISLICQF